MNKLTLMLVILLLTSCAKTGLHVLNNFAKSGQYEIHESIKYSEQTLNLYIPKAKKTTAIVIFFYGGCWGACNNYDKDDYLFIAETLTDKGYAVIIPDYRQYPRVKFATILLDAQAATLWALQNKSSYGIKTDNVFVMGHSSGAHIAAMLVDDERVLGDKLKRINGFIGLAGPYDFYPFNGQYMFELFDKKDNYFTSQPINHINGNEPPHLILQGENDDKVFVHNARNLANKLKKINVQHQLVVYEKMSHAKIIVNLSKPFKNKSGILSEIIGFIDKYSY